MNRTGATLRLRSFFTALFLLALLPGSAAAQVNDPDPQKKAASQPFQARGSLGLSAVFVDIEGSEEKYRSDYNYLSGFALDHFTLELDHADPQNGWMDYLRLDGGGFGDSYPNQEARLQFGKRGAYEFLGRYWKQEYFFSLPSLALGSHGDDSARRTTDLSLRLFPRRGLTLELGYARNYNYGTSFSSRENFTNLYELRDPRRALTQTFRLGAEINRGPVFFSFFQHFQYFKEDSDQDENRLLEPGQLPEVTVSAPVRQDVPATHLIGRYAPSDRFLVEGKYIYSDGHVETSRSELLALKFSEGLTLEQILYATSTSDRPEHRADGTVSLAITDRIVFSNLLEFQTFDVTSSLFSETTWQGVPSNGSVTESSEEETFLSYRLLQDRPQLELFLHPRFSLYGGYRYSDRKVDRAEQAAENRTETHTALAGVSLRPYTGARVSFEFERGSADEFFTSVEPTEVSRFRLSSSFPIGERLTLSPHFLVSRRENAESDAGYESDQNQVGLELLYLAPDDRLTVTAGYTMFHFDSLADLRYFLGGRPQEGLSRYRSHLHFVHLRGEFPASQWLRFRVGYNLVRDSDSSSYPLKRHLAEAGMRFRVSENWSWDLAYQHLSYNEDFFDPQDYKADRLAVTLDWTF